MNVWVFRLVQKAYRRQEEGLQYKYDYEALPNEAQMNVSHAGIALEGQINPT